MTNNDEQDHSCAGVGSAEEGAVPALPAEVADDGAGRGVSAHWADVLTVLPSRTVACSPAFCASPTALPAAIIPPAAISVGIPIAAPAPVADSAAPAAANPARSGSPACTCRSARAPAAAAPAPAGALAPIDFRGRCCGRELTLPTGTPLAVHPQRPPSFPSRSSSTDTAHRSGSRRRSCSTARSNQSRPPGRGSRPSPSGSPERTSSAATATAPR